ncbi:MAG: methylmalonyl-CoA epimerase [Salinirussus sp.]
MELDHAGVVVPDADALAVRYEDLLDCETVHTEDFEDLYLVFLDLGNTYIEFIEPMNGGTIADYLEEHGPGIHHLALETDDIVAAMETARNMGVELIDEEPRPGAWGHTVAFMDPSTTGGILLEFVEH